MDTVVSLQNDKVKLAYGLQNRTRTRQKERKIVLEGTRLVRDAIERNNKPLFVLFQPENVDFELIAELQNRNFQLIPVNAEVMAHVSDTQNPQGIVAVFPMPMPTLPKKPRRVLILDNVRDPGNMGAMLRTAAAAGVDVVILSPGCADAYNPKALRSGMGAHFRVPTAEAEWHEITSYCEGMNIYLTAGDGNLTYDSVDWKADWAVIIGSEAHGVGEKAEILAQKRIRIPMAAKTESLNAVVAAGVVLFEAVRQRK
ncbi:MAG: RNA methyltransferase [Aggregatilineales bacterium]